jgi:hypothetical protein
MLRARRTGKDTDRTQTAVVPSAGLALYDTSLHDFKQPFRNQWAGRVGCGVAGN